MLNYDTLENLAREAGELALEHFNRLSSVPVESKGHLDLVTAADQDVERFVSKRLQALFPDDGVFGEEGNAAPSRSGRVWVIDPIDGTFNFVRGSDEWAVSIGLYAEGKPAFGVVHAPVRRQFFMGGKGREATLNGKALPPLKKVDPSRAVTGIGFHVTVPVEERLSILKFVMDDAKMTFRHNGSAVISMIDVVCGVTDGYLGMQEASWDVMGILPILACLGGETTLNWKKKTLESRLSFACGTSSFLDIFHPILPADK